MWYEFILDFSEKDATYCAFGTKKGNRWFQCDTIMSDLEMNLHDTAKKELHIAVVQHLVKKCDNQNAERAIQYARVYI